METTGGCRFCDGVGLISPAEAADAEAIASLVNGAYRGAGAARSWTHEAELLGGQRTDPATLRGAMAAGSTILLARDAAGALLGCVSVQRVDDEGTWSLGLLSVDPALQAAGLGRRLLEAADVHCKARGGRQIEITVIQLRDVLIGWYMRRGYAPTGERRPFPYGDARVGTPRRTDLHFVVLAKAL